MSQEQDVPPITEDDIANYLSGNPEFFERHAETLSSIQLFSQHGKRAVSLQERQAEMLREKIKSLEGRIMEMVRHGNENVMIADKLQKWTRSLLLTQQAIDLPTTVSHELKSQFLVPQVAIKIWGVNGLFSEEEFATGVSDDAKAFASSLQLPYCGVNSNFEAATWLDQPELASSLALIPLRAGAAIEAFGMLVLASPDPQRFNAGMGTDFLERIGELTSAALSRLRG
ncbi:MAG: DUF484 family protein [Burkholderiales bacterium]|nr:MAG: DUF484 family protein [Burkholderiales bacterium]